MGRSTDGFTYRERRALAGKWMAFELYSPLTLPLRSIAAIGDSPADCRRMLARNGADPAIYECVQFRF